MSVLTIKAWSNRPFRGRLVVSWCVLVLVLVSGSLCIRWAVQATQSSLQSKLSALAKVMAVSIKRMGHEKITPDTPSDDPHYTTVMNEMREWLRRNPNMAAAYTVRLNEKGQYIFICDPASDLNRDGKIDPLPVGGGVGEADTPIGTVYEADDAGTTDFVQAFGGDSGFNNVPFQDDYGVWITATEPIFDEEGNVESIIGVDFWADEWIRVTKEAKFWPSLFLMAFLVFFFVVQYFLLEHQRIEAKLQNYANDLEKNVVELIEAKQRADDASKTKGNFLANMSHEIRTPMNGVIGLADLLVKTPLSDRQSQYVTSIQNSAKSLLTVINDILDISKIESGKFELTRQPFHPREVFDDIFRWLSFQAEEKNLRIQKEIDENLPATLVGDAGRFRQILINLLGNAVKFTSEGYVVLRCRVVKPTESDDKHCTLHCEVEDTGVGIKDESMSGIFKPFEQADTTASRQFGGTGLGLAIVTNLVNMMNGHLEVDSTFGKGSLFRFDVRFECPSEESRSLSPPGMKQPSNDQAKRSLRILLVEDVKINILVATEMLRSMGHEITVAENGIEAIERMRDRDFDVVLMDCQMPLMDGYECTRILRTADSGVRNPRLPVIAMTAHAMSGDREKCLEAGMDDYISKPIDAAILAKKIEAAVFP